MADSNANECMRRIEGTVRHLRLFAVCSSVFSVLLAFGLGIGFVLLLNPATARVTQRVVEAERFDLAEWGRQRSRGTFQMAGYTAQLLAWGKAGGAVIMVPDEEPPWIEVSSTAVDGRGGSAKLSLSSDGQPFLQFDDASGKRRMVLQLDADGVPRLVFYDGAGQAVWSASAPGE